MEGTKQTGGVAFLLYFLDELIRLGYSGTDDAILKARDAGWAICARAAAGLDRQRHLGQQLLGLDDPGRPRT